MAAVAVWRSACHTSTVSEPLANLLWKVAARFGAVIAL
jgi:hypothetical protein